MQKIEELIEQLKTLDNQIKNNDDPKLKIERKKIVSKIELEDPNFFNSTENLSAQTEVEKIEEKVEKAEEIVDNSKILSELITEREKYLKMKQIYKADVDEEIEELNKQIEKLTPPNPYTNAKLNFLDKISDEEASYFLLVSDDHKSNMSLKLHATGELELGLSSNQNMIEQKEYFAKHYRELIRNCKAILKQPAKKKKPEIDLSGIEKGDNWFEVYYSNEDIRYVQHSTKENLEEYYKRMKVYIHKIVPVAFDKVTGKVTELEVSI